MKKLIAAIGHSIVRTPQGSWIPSELYQEIEWPEGMGGRPERTFIHAPDLDPNSPSAYLGGGRWVVEALARLWFLDHSADVAFIGGRPQEMDEKFGREVETISEASVMKHRFIQRLRYLNPSHSVAAVDIGGTRNTADDAREILRLANNYDQNVIVAMAFRLPRLRLLLGATSRVTCCDAEQFLPEHFDEFVAMNRSVAYATTMDQERHGVMRLHAANHRSE
ncbi:hypothetical protein HYW59_01970 [Candidatus Kaiserbacteria bacterium]|nr:hypothetical protein [Candidatus Kaiserbacteria bacterium]